MTEPSYQIVFRGKILSGYTREQVRSNLAQLFRTDPTRIDTLLDAPKTVLKAGISKDAATRYQEALRQAGIMVAMMAEAPAAADAVSASSPVPGPPPQAPTVTASTPPPATAASQPPAVAASGLTLAAVGERILPPQAKTAAQIDTSGLSLAPAVGPLVEARAVAAPQFDLSGISIATDAGPIDRTPKAPPRQIDTSALTLDAPPPPKPETGLSELQKLLSSSVD